MRLLLPIAALFLALPAAAQIAPSPTEIAAYRGLHAAAAKGDAAEIARLVVAGEKVDAVDGHRRTRWASPYAAARRGAFRPPGGRAGFAQGRRQPERAR